MIFWEIFSYAAWALAALLLGWMLLDLIKVSKDYSENFLLSAREGADELFEQDDAQGGKK
jgi:hypothetical protein